MTFEEFLKIIQDMGIKCKSYDDINLYIEDFTVEPYCFYSCEQVNVHSIVKNTNEYMIEINLIRENFNRIFDSILEKICPTISYLKYKSIYRELVNEHAYTSDNYPYDDLSYMMIYCDIRKLYNKLQSMNLILDISKE